MKLKNASDLSRGKEIIMAQIVKFVKRKYPEFYKAVDGRTINIDEVTTEFSDQLPQIQADVLAYARQNGISLNVAM